MASDEFGGVAMEEPTDEFGGVAVAEEPSVKLSPYEQLRMQGTGTNLGATTGPSSPGEVLSLPQLIEAPAAALERFGTGAIRTVRDVLSPTTYLPEEEQAKLRPFKISPEGIGQQTAEEAEPIQPGRSMIEFPRTQLQQQPNAIQRLIEGSSTPGTAITLPFAATGPGSIYFGLQGIKGGYEAVKTLLDPSASSEQKREAAETLPLNVLMTLGGAKNLLPETPAPVQGPMAQGSVLNVPRGAPAPRIELPPGIQKVSPSEAAEASQRMTAEATAPAPPDYHYQSEQSKTWWEKADQLKAQFDASAPHSPERAAARKAQKEHDELAYGDNGDRTLAADRIDKNNPLKQINITPSEFSPTGIAPTDATGWRFDGSWQLDEDGRPFRRVVSPDGKDKGVVRSLHPIQESALEQNSKSPAPPSVAAESSPTAITPSPSSEAQVPLRMWSSGEGETPYLSNLKSDAEAYAQGRSVKEYEVKPKTPFDPSTSKNVDLVSKFDELGGIQEAPRNKAFVKLLKDAGYDSIVGGEKGYGGESNWVVPLDKSILKEITPSTEAQAPSLEQVQKGTPAIPKSSEGQTQNQPIRIQLADGTVVPGLWNGYWEAPGTPFDKAPSVATVVEDKWSHGMLPKGAKILDAVPSFDEWKSGQGNPSQEPVGMGGAALGEITPTGPRGEPTHGVAARVLEERRQQGVIAPVEPGEGISAAESVVRGRKLIDEGANPQGTLDEFNKTKALSADAMAIVRAHGERLAKAAYDAADRFGIHSPEYERAWEDDSAWAKAVKPMSTEWHKIGQAQQGEVEIDTGTFHGLRKAFLDATGKDFTPKQAAEAEGIVKAVKQATQEADKAAQNAFAKIDAAVKDAPPPKVKPGDIGKPDIQTVWKRARALIDAGETDFTAIRHQLAREFGIPVEEVTKLLAQPKGARKVTDEMYVKQAAKRRLQNEAKQWIKNQQIPGWLRFTGTVPRIFFAAKVFGHGTVGMITHAGLNIFNPFAWKQYWPAFFQQFKFLVKPGYHERVMQDLLRDPLYAKARRSGLINDPYHYQDDYQTPALSQWLNKIGLAGTRGFDALKVFRQARFNQEWNSTSEAVKASPEYGAMLADSINHATGAINMRFRDWANVTFFAPKLEGSRWAWMIKDPLIASKTFVDWKNATPAARAFAMSQLKEKAAIAGTYYTLLQMNQGLLSASGSDQKINFTDPRKGDFLAFKAAGHNIGLVGPMIGMVRLFANMLHAAAGKRGKLESLTPRFAEMGEIGSEYARGKLSPFMGFGVDVVSQSDFQGRPLPYSTDKVPPNLKKQGIGPYTYGEYAAGQLSPIPVSEAVREVWHDQGMNDDEIDNYLKALAVGIAAVTGARVSPETPSQAK